MDKDKYQFLPQLGPVCLATARACADSNPEMKQKAAMFASALATSLPDKCGAFMKLTVEGLTANLMH